ncbi:MAG: thioredoxin-disulfide reductase [Candidatus Babeliales bacterium]|nr:thioredoxin-disulfide reductase [Candidatus Babeliales bacterium]
MNKIHKLIIIGSGPAGITAGIYASRAALNPIVIQGQAPGGQLMGTSYVENWPGEKSILGPELMSKLKNQAADLGCQFIEEKIDKVDLKNRPFTLWTNNNREIKTDSLIIATGSEPRKLNCPGESTYWGKGVTTCATCDGAFYKDRPIVIVGGGDTAMEEASFMTKFTNQITVVHILDKLTASHTMKQRVLDNPNINIIYNSTISEIIGNENHITQVVIENTKTKEKQNIKTDVLFLAIGLTPNSAIFKEQLELDKMGYIVLKGETQTSIEGVFAAGDITDCKYRQAITSAGQGCKAALDAQRFLENN